MFAELHCLTHFSFQRGASRPEELIDTAKALGYGAIAITDECSLAGIVKAHVAAKAAQLKLIVGAEFTLQTDDGGTAKVVLLAPDQNAYIELCGLITRGRRRADKGNYALRLQDLYHCRRHCLCIWLPADRVTPDHERHHHAQLIALLPWFAQRLWIGVELLQECDDQTQYFYCHALAEQHEVPLVACNDVHMHSVKRKPLQDVLTAIGHNTTVMALGSKRQRNAQRYLRPLQKLERIYPRALLTETLTIAERCTFSLDSLRYCYPRELVPTGQDAAIYLQQLVQAGAQKRWPDGTPDHVQQQLQKELALIGKLKYEHYFLTVFDLVEFARSQQILCQGRGSAANSAVCYCLGITNVDPATSELLFERFISEERNEPPDIDVDFEHERREEVIQYIYRKYGRDRAALAATVVTYRPRSAIRDVGKALGFNTQVTEALADSLAWWDNADEIRTHFVNIAGTQGSTLVQQFHTLVNEILGFPRHLSQHVGGFIIADVPVWTLVPIENATMAERTIIQWDKEDIEALGLLKVDVLALGMLTAIRKTLALVADYRAQPFAISDIPNEDPDTYTMLQQADSVGVFQVESRAQMSMLPRLKPSCFYDLVIQIAIVRPGPIQGDMVHPYLRRRNGEEDIDYASDDIRSVLGRTLGVPIFQEQAIKLAMVAAGFSGGEADQLRRAMASWGRNGNLMVFRDKLINGMLQRGYAHDFAQRLFEQMKGFGGYGFPESHSASFALLAYVSAWLKCHHPAAFYCGLLNSQPMGFYSPSQLIQDAQRHNITVLPIDVQHSHWQHTLVFDEPKHIKQRHLEPPTTLQLGLCLVKGLSTAAAQRIEQARLLKKFTSLFDLRQRAQLQRDDIDALAAADALRELAGHRHQAHWQSQCLPAARPLLQQADLHATQAMHIALPQPSEVQTVLADYASTGLTLNTHPMALLRSHAPFRHCKTHAQLHELNHGRFVRIAGIVTCRQRPGTASGVLFLTLEDETGNSNIVVWQDVQKRFRRELLTARLLLIKGVLERKQQVIHVIAGEIEDYTAAFAQLQTSSRDFH